MYIILVRFTCKGFAEDLKSYCNFFFAEGGACASRWPFFVSVVPTRQSREWKEYVFLFGIGMFYIVLLLDKQKNLLQLDNESGKAGIPHGHQVKVGRSGTRSKNSAAANPWELPLSRHGPMRCESELSSCTVPMWLEFFEINGFNDGIWRSIGSIGLCPKDFFSNTTLSWFKEVLQVNSYYKKNTKTRYLVIPVPRKLLRFRCWSEPFSLAASTRWPIKRRVRREWRELTLKMRFSPTVSIVTLY